MIKLAKDSAVKSENKKNLKQIKKCMTEVRYKTISSFDCIVFPYSHSKGFYDAYLTVIPRDYSLWFRIRVKIKTTNNCIAGRLIKGL